MAWLLIGLARFWLVIGKAWRDPTFRLLTTLTASLLLVGTLVFHEVEGWSYLDSYYFSAISLATVGYGDFTPQTPAGKLLTTFYIFSGIGLLVSLLTRFADALIQSELDSRERRRLHRTRAREKPAPGGAGAARPGHAATPPARGERQL